MVKRWAVKTGFVVVVTFLASLVAVFAWENGHFRRLSRRNVVQSLLNARSKGIDFFRQSPLGIDDWVCRRRKPPEPPCPATLDQNSCLVGSKMYHVSDLNHP